MNLPDFMWYVFSTHLWPSLLGVLALRFAVYSLSKGKI